MARTFEHAVSAHPVRIIVGAAINLAGFWVLATHI